jgi:hypothetical protein
MAKQVSDTEREAILADIHTGELSRNAIARKHGRSVGTITNIAAAAGLSESAFDRSASKAATCARKADSSARRAEIASGLLDDVAFFRAKFRQGWSKTVVVPGVGAQKVEADDAEIATGLQRLMTSVGIAVDKHMALEKHDHDDRGGAAVDSWLRHIMGADRTSL